MSGRTGALVIGPEFMRAGWMARARCLTANEALFFGPEGEHQVQRLKREQRAKEVCRTCPVVQLCLEHALNVPERAGVWGGMGEDERKNLRRKRRRLT